MGQKQKTEKDKKKRLNDGKNNGQAMHGAHMAHASRLGQFCPSNVISTFSDKLVLYHYFCMKIVYIYWTKVKNEKEVI